MKAKRYRKLGYALISKVMEGSQDTGKCLKSISHATPNWNEHESYQRAWDSLLPVRKIYGMEYIKK